MKMSPHALQIECTTCQLNLPNITLDCQHLRVSRCINNIQWSSWSPDVILLTDSLTGSLTDLLLEGLLSVELLKLSESEDETGAL